MGHRNMSADPTNPSRRDFLRAAALAAPALLLPACATNPVTGKREFMLVSEAGEIQIDHENAPHQFSEDFGAVGDPKINQYVTEVGGRITQVCHRPGMPYSFRGVNASHINAYAFPGGSIAATRGILYGMESEAELAALIGHEVGHVCARHSAQQMSKGMLANLAVAGATIAISQSKKYGEYAGLAASIGSLGTGLLLARYSRADERQADALGMDYMVKAGYPPIGMVRLMDLLRHMERNEPSALELMFATHPMSAERYDTAIRASQERYAEAAALPDGRERYLDTTAGLRRMGEVIKTVQKADRFMGDKKLAEAETEYARAIKAAPGDYEALMKMSKCLLAQDRPTEARLYAVRAAQANPGEPGAHLANGLADLQLRRFEDATSQFTIYEQKLPGNPNTRFLRALALDQSGHPREAAEDYAAFLQSSGGAGDRAQHAIARLQSWGYLPAEQK